MKKSCNMRSAHAGTIAGAVAALFAASYASSLLANPTGAQVVSGTVSVSSPGTGQMKITQTTPKAIVNWNTFSIGPNQSVTIVQPSASATQLDRVLGNDPSLIAGRLQANGNVFLVNPAGVIFAQGSSVNVGSMIASTLNIANADFLAGNYHFVGTSAASISNAGTLTAQSGGTIALLGATVSSAGTVSARLGTVALGAGSDITVDFAGDGLTKLTINQGAANALLGNTGTLAADGGTVVMSAQAAEALAGTVINQQGIVRAQSLSARNGHIVLDGGTNGVTQVSGTLDASGGTGLTGGTIDVTGYDVALLAGANLNASGVAGGGAVHFGGGAAGADPNVRNANAIWMAPTASINADALVDGNGGEIAAYSTTASRIYGALSATGGAQGGNGGSIETSGHYLDTTGATIDASAPNGKAGTWLLDPYDVNIVADNADIGGTPVTPSTADNTATFAAAGNDSYVYETQIEGPLDSGTSVTIATGAVGSSGGQNGNISIQTPISVSQTAPSASNVPTLTFSAAGSINDGYNITSTSGALNLVFNANVGGATPANSVTLSNVTIDTNGGNFTIGNTGSAVSIFGSTVNTEAGSMNITGTSSTTDGIALSYSLLASTTGNITLTGTGTTNVVTDTTGGNGVNMEGSAIQTVDGAVSITGTAISGGGSNNGVYIWSGEYEQGGTVIPNLDATGKGTFTVNGSVSGTGGDGINVSNAAIGTTGGAVSLTGTSAVSGYGTGVSLTSVPITTTGGDLTISGSAPVTGPTTQQYGAFFDGTTIQTGGGNVSVSGDASGSGTPLSPTYGLYLADSSIESDGGSISVSGTSNVPAGPDSYGAYVASAGIGGPGSISISGTASGQYAEGLLMNTVDMSTTTGTIVLSGSATAGFGYGVDVSNSTIGNASGNVTLNGTISVTGSGNLASYDTFGVYFENSQITTLGGNVGFTGSVNNAGMGVDMAYSSISTVNGSVSLVGSAAGNSDQSSIGTQVVSGYSPNSDEGVTDPGAFIITGTGSVGIVGTAGGYSGYGVNLENVSAATTSGAISIAGTSTATQYGYGIYQSYSSLSTTSGNVTLTGVTTGASLSADGVVMINGLLSTDSNDNTTQADAIQTGSGAISVSGSVPATSSGSVGLDVNGASVASTSGTIALTGLTTGTPAVGLSSSGVVLQNNEASEVNYGPSSVTTGSGALSLYGSGSGSIVQGVLIADGTTITSNGGGAIDIRGVVTSPTTSTSGGNIQYDYGTLILDGTVTSTQPGSAISIAGSTNTSDAGLAFGAVPLPSNSNSGYSYYGYTAGPVSISGAPNGALVLRAANDNTADSLLSRSATISVGGGDLSILPATVDPATFAFTSQDAAPITLLGTGGGLSIDPTTFATFSNFQTLILGSSTQTGLITVNGACASGSSPCMLAKPSFDFDLTLSSAGAGSQGIQLLYGIALGTHTLTLVSGGPVTDPGGIQAAQLLLSGPGTFTLTDPQNDVGVLAMDNAGTVNFVNSVGFVIGPVTGRTLDAATNLVTPLVVTNSSLTGNLTAQALTGDIALGSTTSGGPNTSLSAGGTIDLVMEQGVFNSPDAGTVSAGNGWRIWASTWNGETRGNVQPDTLQPNFYGCTFGAGCSWGGVVPTTGDHYVYVQRPTLIVTADGAVRFAGAPNPAFAFSVSGFINGDTVASGLTGGLSTTATPNSPGGHYAINPHFLSSVGYIVNDIPGDLTVTPIDPSTPLALSGLQAFFGPDEKTFVYENNLQGTNICIGSNQPIFTTEPPGQTQDLLAVEWKRVRSQPNLNSCMVSSGQHGCGDF